MNILTHVQGTRMAVDQLTWLQSRVKSGSSLTATLVVSAENGNLFFWNALKGQYLGGFHAAHTDLGTEVGWCCE